MAKKKEKKKEKKSASQPVRPLKIVRTIKDIRQLVAQARARRKRIALVPTMGYLHQGHLSLVEEARRRAGLVVVSIFVNPLQFGPNEDLDRYPRDLSGDRKKLGRAGADVIFYPDPAEMYPEGFQTFVEVSKVTRDFCGASRPGHFRGVATVVCKLFNIVQPDLAIFGEKDYQQLVTIKRMVQDLNLQVEIVGMPTVREEDGLAMSSRNTYLSPEQRKKAATIYRALSKAERLLQEGERDAAEIAACALDLLRDEPDIQVEYVAVVDPQTMERILQVEDEAILMVAVHIGSTRLIDNIWLRVKKARRRNQR